MTPRKLPHVFLLAAAVMGTAVAAQPQANGLLWSTYLGGGADDYGHGRGHGVAGNGDVLFWGQTFSQNFPATPTAFQRTLGGSADGYFGRMKADGTGLVWSSYLGGSGADQIFAMIADDNGVVTVCGETFSNNFPTTPGTFQPSPRGRFDAFVARFVWNGQRLKLLWSTRLGASGDEDASQLAIRYDGAIVVAGRTNSAGFPMPGNPFQGAIAGGYDGYVAVLDASGSTLLASTFVGGAGNDFTHINNQGVTNLVLDGAGNPAISGTTTSRNFPVSANALQSTHAGGGFDMSVIRLDRSLGRMIYGSYLGGSGSDGCVGMTQDAGGRLVLQGYSTSVDFPTTPGAFQGRYGGACALGLGDGIVTILDPRAQGPAQLVWSTYFGSNCEDFILAAPVDSCGLVTVTGATNSSGFPTTPGAFQRSWSGGFDGFVARFDPRQTGARQLVYSTLLRGNLNDQAMAIDFDGLGNVIVSGHTYATNFPTTNGVLQAKNAGGLDAFVTKLSMLPASAYRYGLSTQACAWPIYQDVDGYPAARNGGFTLRVAGAPPRTLGGVLLGTPNPTGTAIAYLRFYLSQPLAILPTATSSAGCAELRVPAVSTPNSPIATQWYFLTTPRCPGSGVLATSEGLHLW